MNAHDRIAADRDAVERLRQILANMDTGERTLQIVKAGGEMLLTCDAGPGTYAELAVILPDASQAERSFFVHGASDALAALRVIDRADTWFRQHRDAPVRQQGPKPQPKKKHGSECAMLCNKPAFGHFVAERYGPADKNDPTSVAEAVKKELGIASRAVLNHDAAAVTRWLEMRAEYQAWLQT